jgi:hypothetical protein
MNKYNTTKQQQITKECKLKQTTWDTNTIEEVNSFLCEQIFNVTSQPFDIKCVNHQKII